MLTTVEKVVFLQDVDVFARIPLEDLVYVAAITDEIEIAKGREIFREGDISDSMYLVVEGKVRLHRQEIEVLTADAKDVFGTWALFDDETRVVTATALEDCHMLRLDKEKFLDLLTDYTRIVEGILQIMATRLRGLMSRTSLPFRSE
jgi:CRP/FNR family cyclic AMP-dependent transcriptional regulator